MKRKAGLRTPLFSAGILISTCLFFGDFSRADIYTTGQVRNQANTIQWDWITATPTFSDGVVIGHDGSGTVTLNNHNDLNGLYDIACNTFVIGSEAGASGALLLDGTGVTISNASFYIANGPNSTGSVTLQNGASKLYPGYVNANIYLGQGANSKGTMTLKDPQTAFRLSDYLYMGLSSGSSGELIIQNGAVFESMVQYLGYSAGSYGKVIVEGSGSQMKTWYGDLNTNVGWIGSGQLIIRNEGYVLSQSAAHLGYANGAQGIAEVTGAGSLWEAPGSFYVGRGDNANNSTPGMGYLKLARGGKVKAGSFYAGYSSYKPQGLVDFIIGNTGTGAVNCGWIEASNVRLNIVYLQMHVDPGVWLTPGTQFTLIDYTTLGVGTSYKRFNGINEGSIYTSPEGYNFRINYATDLGGGNLAITATVVGIPLCVVDEVDFGLLLDRWLGSGCGAPDWCGGADLDQSTAVGLGDFALMARYWMNSCPDAWPWQ